MKRSRTGAFGLALLLAGGSSALAGVTATNRDVVAVNAIFRKPFEWIPAMVVQHGSWPDRVRGVYVRPCQLEERRLPGADASAASKCLIINVRGADHSYEDLFDEERQYVFPLYPNTPQVRAAYRLVRRQGRPAVAVYEWLAVVSDKGVVTPKARTLTIDDSGVH